MIAPVPDDAASDASPALPSAALLTVERVAALQRVRFFRDVPGHALVAVARVLDEVRVDAGESFIRPGAVEDWMFVVVDGCVRVLLEGRAVREIGSGGVVGDLAVLAPAPRSAEVVALEPTLLLKLRRAPFEELLDDHPEIARAVIASLAGMLQSMPPVPAG